MAYRNPAFFFRHELAFDSSNTTTLHAVDDGHIGNLWDYRGDELAKWDSAASGVVERVEVSPRQEVSSGVYHELDTLILPAGGAYTDCNAQVAADDNAGFTSPDFPVNVAITDNGLQVLTFNPAYDMTALGYMRVGLSRTAATVVEAGEFWVTEKREMSRGPDPGWDISSRSHSTESTSLAGIDSSRVTGPSVLTFRLKWNALGAADIQIIDDLLSAAGTARPFFFTAPDDRYAEVILCKLSREPQIRQQHANPAVSGPVYEVQLDLVEVAG